MRKMRKNRWNMFKRYLWILFHLRTTESIIGGAMNVADTEMGIDVPVARPCSDVIMLANNIYCSGCKKLWKQKIWR